MRSSIAALALILAACAPPTTTIDRCEDVGTAVPQPRCTAAPAPTEEPGRWVPACGHPVSTCSPDGYVLLQFESPRCADAADVPHADGVARCMDGTEGFCVWLLDDRPERCPRTE